MVKQIQITADGSPTIAIPEMKVTYHSVHGAVAESKHVYIEAGLIASNILEFIGVHSVLEIGFGTGLNALLTLEQAEKHKNRIYYTAVEPYPLEETLTRQLNYCEQLELPRCGDLYDRMHECGWEEMYEITQYFRLTKHRSTLDALPLADESFNIIYFDAFAPTAQPGLWTEKIFSKLYRALTPGGLLATYCSKGDVRRAMNAAGFSVEKLPGPKGKREMLRGKKVDSR